MDIARVLARTNYFRRSEARVGGRGNHKEWLHFCISNDELDLIVNLSAVDDVDGQGKSSTERAHLVAVARVNGRWWGDVDRFWDGEIDVGGGSLDARLGDNSVALVEGALRVRARLREQPIEVDLLLRPETFPSLSNNIALCAGGSLSWLVVPRLRATGLVRIASRTHRLDGAIAYHDHNWGYFSWGADFAWEWGYGAPSDAGCPWSFMFVRLSDRALTTTRTRALTLWRGAELARSFRGDEVVVKSSGFLRPAKPFKVPPVMGLLAPGSATEVPREMTVEVDSDGDRLELSFASEDVAQIIVPEDRGVGVTIVNEVVARLTARGQIHGERIHYEGRGIFEVLK